MRLGSSCGLEPAVASECFELGEEAFGVAYGGTEDVGSAAA